MKLWVQAKLLFNQLRKDLRSHPLPAARLQGRPLAHRRIDAGGATEVQAWLDARHRMNPLPTSPLFCTAAGGRLTEAYVRRLLPRLAEQAGIARRVHAHAAQLCSEGVDIGIISKQLGHRSIATTARYLDHVAPLAVVEAISKRAW